jgi:beta-lactamase regulating signal transducer with metallopeptidase domain
MSWLDPLLVAALDNALGATVLAGLVFLVTRWWRNPLVVHALWLLVLIKLVAPPLAPLPVPGAAFLPWRSDATVVAPALQPSALPERNLAAVEGAASQPLDSQVATEPVPLPNESQTPKASVPAEPLAVAPSPPTHRDFTAGSPLGTAAAPIEAAQVEPASAAVPGDVPAAWPWRWQELVAAAWLLGSAAYFVIAGLRIARFHRAVAALPAADEGVQRLATNVGESLSYRGRLIVRASSGHTPPLLWAVGRPTILLPTHLIASLTADELAGILAHEIAHLKRRDPWVRWFELFVVGLYWWHPVAWYARHALRDAEEMACDALVLDRFGSGPDAYVRGLLHALDLANSPAGPSLASGLGRKHTLQRRVEAMLARRYAPRLGWAAGSTLALVALACLPLSMRASPAEESPTRNSVAATTDEKANEASEEAVPSPATDAPQSSKAQDTLDPRIGPAADLDPRVRERQRQYLRPPYWNEEELVTVRGKAVDEQGRPLANADIDLRATVSGTIAHTRSNAAGEFKLRIPPGYLEQPSYQGLLATSEKGDLRGFTKLPEKLEPFTVVLNASQPIEARVVDAQGTAVPRAAFTILFGDGLTSSAATDDRGIARVELPKSVPLEMAFVRKEGVGMAVVPLDAEGPTLAEKVRSPLEFKLAGARRIAVRAIDGRDGKPVAGLPASLRLMKDRTQASGGSVSWELPELQTFTDEKGEARFAWASPDQPYFVTVRGWDRALRATQDQDYVTFEPGSGDETMTLEFWPQVKVAGQVRFADGRPAADVPVRMSPGGEAKTDASGRFETEVEANSYCLIVAGDQQGVSPAKAIVVGHESPPLLEFVLGPAIRVFGADPDFRRVRLEQSTDLAYENLPLDQHLPPRLGQMIGRPTIERTAETDTNGNFEFFVGPGNYALLGPRDTHLESTPRFKLTDQQELHVNLRDSPPEVRLKGRVVRRDAPQTGVADAFIDLDTPPSGPPLRSDAKGNFSVTVPDRDQIIEVHGKGGLGRAARLQGVNEIVIPVGPLLTMLGRVVDPAGKPLQGQVSYHIVPDREGGRSRTFLSMGQAKLDGEGRFAFDRIVPGWNYSLSVTLEAGDAARRRPRGRPSTNHLWLGVARADSGQPLELGDLVAEVESEAAPTAAKPAADPPSATSVTRPQASAESTPKPLDPRLGPGEWVDPQVREYLRNYMLGPDWNRSATTIKGRVVDAEGQPAANVDVVAQTNLFGTISIARTDERGEFVLDSADAAPALIATSKNGALLGFFRASRDESAPPAESNVIKLEPPREIDARVVDGQQQPVANAIVTAMFGEGLTAVATTDAAGRAKLRVPQAAPLEAVFARKDNVGLDVVSFDSEGKPERAVGASPFDFTLQGARTVTLHALDGRTGKAAPGVIASYQVTHSNNGQQGLHTLAELWKFVGGDGAASFAFAPADANAMVMARVFESKLFANSDGAINFDPQYRGNEYTLEFWPKVKLIGQVRFPDGRPAVGMPVLVGGAESRNPQRHLTATTDSAGTFELEVDANDYYLIAAGDKQWATPSKSFVVGHESPPPIELTLGPAIRVFGRDQNLRRVVLTAQPSTAYQALPRSELLPLRLTLHPIRSQRKRTAETNADGSYEFFVGPGTYSVDGPPGVERVATPAFTLTDEKEYDVDRGAPRAVNSRVKLRIVRADDPEVGLGRAHYYIHRFDGQIATGARADAAGVAEIDSGGGRFVIEALDADGKLVAMIEGKPGNTEVVAPLGVPAVVRGRLVDSAGRRFRGRVDYHAVRGSDRVFTSSTPSVSHGQATANDDGRFVLDKLAPGWTYSLSASLDFPDAPKQGRSKSAWLGTAHAGDLPVDLGDLVIEPTL